MTKKELRAIRVTSLAPNQYIIRTSTGTTFQSYDSPICTRFKDGSIELYPHWNYSSTTSKYRSRFLNETTAETQANIASGKYKLKEPT